MNNVIHIRDRDVARRVTLKVHGLNADPLAIAAANHLLAIAGRIACVGIAIEDAELSLNVTTEDLAQLGANLDQAIAQCLQEAASAETYRAAAKEGRSIIDKINVALRDGAKFDH